MIKSPVIVSDQKTLARVLKQGLFVTMPKARYDELIGQIEYLEQVIESLKQKIQDTRSFEEIVEQSEDMLDEQLASSPVFQKRVAEARANYLAGKGGNWNDLGRRRRRKQR
ncbi:MAG: hypothetical protein HZC40_02910 [Chloroflexi bacterium]|nr:hypothetical protein [Chloroflexota bacterium]